ncbi:hypothetical protein PS6_006099 [Mucor atramentarius]
MLLLEAIATNSSSLSLLLPYANRDTLRLTAAATTSLLTPLLPFRNSEKVLIFYQLKLNLWYDYSGSTLSASHLKYCYYSGSMLLQVISSAAIFWFNIITCKSSRILLFYSGLYYLQQVVCSTTFLKFSEPEYRQQAQGGAQEQH